MNQLEEQGFEILHHALPEPLILQLQEEADKMAQKTGTTCVRHIREHSAIFDTLSRSQPLLSLLPKHYQCVRSILFDKTERNNWPVAWHQDLTISVKQKIDRDGYQLWSFKDGSPHVQPPVSLLANMITLRLHLDPTPASNGALKVIPRSHLHGKIPPESIKNFITDPPVTCECDTGDILMMKPLLLHASNKSTQPNRRRIIHLEFAKASDLDTCLEWYEK